MRRLYFFLFIGLISLAWLAPLRAGAFGNNSLTIPKVGVTFFDVPFLPHSRPWGIARQWTFGTSFMQAINYRWWWLAETNMGFGKLTAENAPYIGSFSGGAGIRYNIFQEDFRPHFGVVLHYLHLLGNGVKDMPLNLGWPIFVGLKPYFGLEWLFYSEMALSIDASYAMYVNINEPFRQVLHAGLSFAIYF
ncbi:MAG TPA: hypothetical protein VEL47_06305 [Myxococcota bacterium]|nr:hypothetical protein [Myxococcota bacterium]